MKFLQDAAQQRLLKKKKNHHSLNEQEFYHMDPTKKLQLMTWTGFT